MKLLFSPFSRINTKEHTHKYTSLDNLQKLVRNWMIMCENLFEKYGDGNELFTREPVIQKNTNLVDDKVSQLVRHQIQNRSTHESMVGSRYRKVNE